MKTNTLYAGDCLDRMREWPDACVDLIYLDPPFNSKTDYNILFGKEKDNKKRDDLAQMTAFEDTWEWNIDAEERVDRIINNIAHPAHYALDGFYTLFRQNGNGMLAYLSYMAERLAEMHRLLKSTGSIYLHCDPTASHYLKIVMDEVFGGKNFRNEVVWSYRRWSGKAKAYQKMHDTLLFYAKQKGNNIWNWPTEPKLPSSNPYKSTKAVDERGVTINVVDKSVNVPNTAMRDVWDISRLGPSAGERLGYPTQKPLRLVNRVIEASSNKGDVVLDPFCGCGTTIHAAHNLKRKWIGIDISYYALEVIRRERMKDFDIELSGEPANLDAATYFANKDPFEFEKWAVTRIHGFAPNAVQRGDGGIDGRARILYAEKNHDLCIAQVKSGAPSVDALRAFQSNIAGGKAEICLFITLEKQKETPTIKKLIAQSGQFEIGGKQFNRFVMWSIEEFFRGIEPRIPYLAHPRTRAPLQEDITAQ